MIVVKHTAGSPPAPLPRLVRDLAEHGAAPGGEGLTTWTATSVSLGTLTAARRASRPVSTARL